MTRPRAADDFGVEQDIRGQRCQPANLLAEGAGVFDEDGDIVIRIGPVIAPRSRAVENHPLEPLAIDFAKRRAKAGQDRVCLWIVGHCFLAACIIQGFRRRGAGAVIERGGFALRLSYLQLFIMLLTLALMIGFTTLIAATPLGRAPRACEQDMRMAALLGVDVDRVISLTL